ACQESVIVATDVSIVSQSFAGFRMALSEICRLEFAKGQKKADLTQRRKEIFDQPAIPSFCLASSLILLGSQGGSHTKSTVASSTPSKVRIFDRASLAIIPPIPQPGAVSVIFTATRPSLTSTS